MALLRTHKCHISTWVGIDFDYELRKNLPVFDAESATLNKIIKREKIRALWVSEAVSGAYQRLWNQALKS